MIYAGAISSLFHLGHAHCPTHRCLVGILIAQNHPIEGDFGDGNILEHLLLKRRVCRIPAPREVGELERIIGKANKAAILAVAIFNLKLMLMQGGNVVRLLHFVTAPAFHAIAAVALTILTGTLRLLPGIVM